MMPHEQMAQMLHGYWVSQALFVAARLHLADHLAEGSYSADELAQMTNTHPPALYRLLRALASIGVFAEQPSREFVQTPLSEQLRSDVPGSLWAMARMNADTQYAAWGELLHCVQTGRTGFEKTFGMPLFDYLSRHPDQGRIFDRAMEGIHGHETAAMLDAYDLTEMRTVVDVGGGNGTTLIGLLHRHPEMQGILFDLPAVAEEAKPRLAQAGLANRCQAIGGSFFDSVPAGADAYLLRHIIHDWDDEQSGRILQAVRQALPATGRVLVVENLIEPGNSPSFGKMLDLTMLVIPGGQERTEEEYRALFAASGLRLSHVVPTWAGVSVLEAVHA